MFNNNSSFINPYNFVSLGRKKVERSKFIDQEKDENLTGYIDITLDVRNSLIIPGQYLADKNEYDYYKYPNSDKPVIPGSQIRGVIRNVYETITDSCLSNINKSDSNISQRIQAGNFYKDCFIMMYDNGWILIPAHKYIYKKDVTIDENNVAYINGEKFEDFDLVSAKTFSKKNQKLCDNITHDYDGECILHISHKNDSSKHRVSIFRENYNSQYDIPLSEKDIQRFVELLDIYKEFAENAKKTNDEDNHYTEDYENYRRAIKDKQPVPVFANVESRNKIYISPAQIGRKLSYKNLKDCYTGYETCSSKEHCCPACSMFGFIKNKENLTGKLKFMDLTLTDDSKFLKVGAKEFISLEPKISNLNFYANPESNDWDDSNIRIRGRKFYWHIDRPTTPIESENKNIYSHYHVITKTSFDKLQFKGRVYFRDIKEKELKYLIFALCLSNDNTHMHKIGHAKPYGYGSVKIKCTDLYFRKINLENDSFGIESIKQNLNDYLLTWDQLSNEYISKKSIDELKAMTDVNTVSGRNVVYPYINQEDKQEGHFWFADYPNTKLPSVSSDSSTLILSAKAQKKDKK